VNWASWLSIASAWVDGSSDGDGTSTLGWLNNPDNWGSDDDGGDRLDDGSGGSGVLDDGGTWEGNGGGVGVTSWEWSWGWLCCMYVSI